MSCISFALSDEIEWLDSYERKVLGQMLLGLQGVTCNMDNLFIRIILPYNNPNHSRWFSGRKRMYNNQQYCHCATTYYSYIMWISCTSDPFMILLASEIMNLTQSEKIYFTHTDEHFEMVLGDVGYVGADRYIPHHMGRERIPLSVDVFAINAFNKLHARHQVKVEWGIGGLKQKFRRLMKRFHSTCPNYCQFLHWLLVD